MSMAVERTELPLPLVLWMLGAAGGCAVVQLSSLRQWRHVGMVLLLYVPAALPVLARLRSGKLMSRLLRLEIHGSRLRSQSP